MKHIDGVDPTVIRKMVEKLAEERVRLGEQSGHTSLRAEQVRAHDYVIELIADYQQERLVANLPKIDKDAQAQLHQAVLDTSFHGAQLWRIWCDYPDATNLSVYGTKEARLELAGGEVIALPPIVNSDQELRDAVRGLRAIAGRPDARWDPTTPELELIMDDDGTRVTAVDFICPHPFVTLRRPTLANVSLEDLVENGTMSEDCAEFLAACVLSGQRILVAGSMNSGKTVMLRALAASLRSDAAVLVGESQPELRIDKFPDTYPSFTVPLAARRPNSEGRNEVTVRDLVEVMQRMSPTVVIVGECRGPEVTALAAALSQGYQVFSTIHANSATNAVANAALYYQEQTKSDHTSSIARLANGTDIVIFMDRRLDNKRVIAEVVAVGEMIEGAVKTAPLYLDDGTDTTRSAHPVPDELLRKLQRVGYTRPEQPRLVG